MGSQTYFGVWSGQPSPSTLVAQSGQFSFGLTLYSRFDQQVLGLAFYRQLADPANHIGILTYRGAPGARSIQKSVAFIRNPAGSGPTGWQHAYFNGALLVPANQYIDIICIASGYGYVASTGALATSEFHNTLSEWRASQDGIVDPYGVTTPNGRISTASALNPNTATGGDFIGLDVISVKK